MKLLTDIPPRRDGTVILTVSGGQKYTFADNGLGELEADITDEDHIAFAVSTQRFYPADDGDSVLASELVQQRQDKNDGDDEDADDDDKPDMNALPVEANTPPAAFKPAPARRGRKPAADK